MSKFYIISLDPAQLHDYSALAVIEVEGNVYRIVDLKRKQHLPYTEIVSWVKKVFMNPKFAHNPKDGIYSPVFVLDITGVGKAIQDMFTAEGVRSTGIQLTGGEAESRAGNTYRVSKTSLVGKFLAAWDEGRV